MEMKDRIQIATCDIMRDYLKKRDIDKMDVFANPDRDVVIDILRKTFIILYPGYYRERNFRIYRYDNRVSLLDGIQIIFQQKNDEIPARIIPLHCCQYCQRTSRC